MIKVLVLKEQIKEQRVLREASCESESEEVRLWWLPRISKKSDFEDQLEAGLQTLEARLWKLKTKGAEALDVKPWWVWRSSNGSANVKRSMNVTFIKWHKGK